MTTEPAPGVPAERLAALAVLVSEALGEPAELDAAEPLGDGVGLLASLWRVWTRAGRRYVLKAPTEDRGNRAIAHRFGYYQREAGAYRDLLDTTGRWPVCHGITDTDGGPVLLLEDLHERTAGDQLHGATTTEAFAAAELAADLHATFWNDPRLAVCAWLPGPNDPVLAVYDQLFRMTWDAFCERVAGLVPPAHLAAAARAIDRFDEIGARFDAAPRTLLHGDFRLDNLMFDGDRLPSALDWQLAQWGRGPCDLALFAAGSIEPDVRRACEDELVARYHDRLIARGVTGYDLEQCRLDYRLGHVRNLPNPVTALVAVSGGNERGRQLLLANARRALAAVADHEPFLSS
jgi:aminoglycoside phosphotransferase (APT) family kinase protein